MAAEVEDSFPGRILHRADMQRLRGLNAVFRFVVSGEDGGAFVVAVRDGQVELPESGDCPADIVVRAEAARLAALLDGKLAFTRAVVNGMLRFEGDVTLAMKLPALFGIPVVAPNTP